MNFGYYPGCSLHSTAKEFDMSIRTCSADLGLDLVEVSDWNCCGASPAHASNEELSLSLPLRNLKQADEQQLKELLVPCAACYSRLKTFQKEAAEDSGLLAKLGESHKEGFLQKIAVKHLLEVLYADVGLEKIKSLVTRPLNELRVVSYYGCLLTRPPKVVNFDDVENPTTMDEIIEALGGNAVDWSHKTECCGASLALSRTDIVCRLVNEILEAARINKADCIAVACPLCHANLDMRQTEVEKKYQTKFDIPILYISQLVGLALGKDHRELGLNKHLISAKKIMEKIDEKKEG